MSIEKHLKELLIHQLRQKLSKLKQDVELVENPPPDLKIMSYGVVLGYIDVVTEKTVSNQRVKRWKELVFSGEKLTVLLSKEEKLKITEILWKEGIAEKVSIGTYEIVLLLP
ncbi:MAG: hypothetical protein ABDH16_04300 [Thermodesulfovibrionaceae bacterium]